MATTVEEVHVLATELRILVGGLRRCLREQSHEKDLTGGQKSVLLRIDLDGSGTVTSLAKAEGMRPQSMGATIASLESAGLIQSAPHPTDGRQTIWTLTDACREWLSTSRAKREDWLFKSLQSNLTVDEQKQLRNALPLFKKLIEIHSEN